MSVWNWIKNLFGFGGGSELDEHQEGDPPVVPSLEDSCVAHYKMNDNTASTVVIDEKGNNGTSVRNTNLMHVDGIGGGALDFDGTSDNANTNQILNTTWRNNCSIAGWFKLAEESAGGIIFGVSNEIGDNDNCELYIFIEPTDILGYYQNQVDFPARAEATVSNLGTTWHQVAFIVKQLTETTVKTDLYLDGVLNATDTKTMIMSTFTLTDFPVIGAMIKDGDVKNWFEGSLDNITIFNRALNSEEIALLYNSGRGTEEFQSGQQLDLSGSEILLVV